jgi:hypothetical protein
MFGKITSQLKAVRGWFQSGGVAVPNVGPILPIDTQIGAHRLILHSDGRIEGDIDAVEHYLKTFSTSSFVEDRMLFWLFLQWWRQQKEMEKLMKDMADNYHQSPEEEDLAEIEQQLKPVPVYDMFEEEGNNAIANTPLPEFLKPVTPVEEFEANSGPLIIEEPVKMPKKGPKREKVIMTANGPVTVKYDH